MRFDPSGPPPDNRGMPFDAATLPEVYPTPPIDGLVYDHRPFLGSQATDWQQLARDDHPPADYGGPVDQLEAVLRRILVRPIAAGLEGTRNLIQGSPEEREEAARQAQKDSGNAIEGAPPPAPLLPPGYQSKRHIPRASPVFDDHPVVPPGPLDNIIPPGLTDAVNRSIYKGAAPGTDYGPPGTGYYVRSPLAAGSPYMANLPKDIKVSQSLTAPQWYDTTKRQGPPPPSMLQRFADHFGMSSQEAEIALENALRAALGPKY